ncbi:restriction endonuclease subunit S [Aequorivita sp. H23M31]|uniref:Restriction endonuclease subunit S n=1 Tax=Aequorivita ciconiae TaxID=2494375 RepID=A0A410G1U7_9FLAO|nr:restriction endonuclease subunit S [Aequorivita sp. H23M31]QAA81220.1 restriction endonuclease subunit S [Aequorivita sp. H23M31]
MKRYHTYKDSGIEWLGEIPKHWEVSRIKDIFDQISSNGSELEENTYVPLENIESFTGKLLKKVSNDNNESTNLFKSGDILLNKLRPYLGKILLPDFDGGVSGEVVVLRSNILFKNDVEPKYFFYRFLSTKFIFKINSLSDGVKMPRTNPTKILGLEMTVPPFPEQTAIVQYLDTKTQAIDQKVRLLEKKIGCYKELRQSIINDAVTKGLDNNVALKESGIDWIGQIPEHWEVVRVKELFKISRGRVIPKTELLDDGQFPVYSSQTENEGILGYINTFDFETDLITWTTDGVNAGTVFRRKGKFSCTNICGTLIPKNSKKTSLDYFGYAIAESTKHNKRIDTNGAKIMSNEMAVIHIIEPPHEEQIAIAQYLDQKTQTIDLITANIQKQITALKELRKTLINEVVTGKKRVYEPIENTAV